MRVWGAHPQRVKLMAGEREALEDLRKRQRSARSLAFRAGIILGCARGVTDTEVAKQLRTTGWTVGFWRKRFNRGRLESLYDEPRVGAPRSISDERVEEVITTTLESMPKDATHWSSRALAQRLGMSQSSIGRIWRAFGLQPHRSKAFSLSQDPQLIEKVRDIVGLYMEPPVNAVVLCVDEKSQIQALQRSQPLLPMRPGQVERRTHDYVRHGTTSLFAALEVATGNVLAESAIADHRSMEFRRLFGPGSMRLCLKIKRSISSWITMPPTRRCSCATGWPSALATTCTSPLPTVPGSIRWNAGSLNSVRSRSSEAIITRFKQLQEAIETFVKEHNASPKPFSLGQVRLTRFSARLPDLLEPPFYKKSLTRAH